MSAAVPILDRFRLDGKVALVTGASRGLGAGMAVALAGAGADVVLHASTQPASATAAAIAAATGRTPVTLTADLADRAAADRLMADAIAAFGRLDILINNAGMVRRQPAAEHADDDWDRVLEVNLSSMFRLCRAAGRHMIERRQGGKIVNIASLLSFQGGITVPGYAAAKGGVMQLTKALANEWASQGINVNAIAPGYMETDNTAPLRADATRFGRSPSASPPGAGARRRISPAPRSSWHRRRPTTSTGTCSSSTAAGWAAEREQVMRLLALIVMVGRSGAGCRSRRTRRTTGRACRAESSTRARPRCPA